MLSVVNTKILQVDTVTSQNVIFHIAYLMWMLVLYLKRFFGFEDASDS